jgi:hypothetical protein
MMDTSEIEVTGPDQGRIALDDGYGEYGEPVRLIRDETGAPVEFWVNGARSAPETMMAKQMRDLCGPPANS